VVTGASSGIGACSAQHLAARGFRVFGTVRRPEDGAALERAGVTPVPMDVTDAASVARARAAVARALAGAPLAGLVNNAGIPAAGPLELVPLAELRQVLEVNLVGAVAVTQAFLPLLKAARGRIVNISSVAGRSALPFMGAYAASKFALEAASDSLRRELLPFGVRVIVIEPGSFRTKIWSKVQAMDLSRYQDSPYGAAFARFGRAALRGAEQAPPPDKVARAVRRALTARRPPLRIVVPPHPLDRLSLWIPDRWLDWLIYRFLWKRPITPPAPPPPAPPAGSARAVPPRSAPRSRES
jgi:NAD(P)-dependent dehydrogenase (short-subunit alcohol dehydrogenase family)